MLQPRQEIRIRTTFGVEFIRAMSKFGLALFGVFAVIGVTMVGLIIWAGARSNLWDELVAIARIPWGLVTLADLSAGLLFVAFWIALMERRWWPTAGWIVLVFCIGNLATAIYLCVRIRRCGSLMEAFTPGKRSASESPG